MATPPQCLREPLHSAGFGNEEFDRCGLLGLDAGHGVDARGPDASGGEESDVLSDWSPLRIDELVVNKLVNDGDGCG